mgnify:CR=1 FL=1
MNRRSILGICATTALGFALPGSAIAQQKSLKDQLTGTWINVANTITARDGSKRPAFGPHPKGILILAASEYYAQFITNSDLPKFKLNDRLKGTPEENEAVVHGTIAHYGTWSVDEASKTLTRRIEANMFPNQTATKQSITLTGDELKLVNTNASTGGIIENVYKRAK